VVGVCKRCTLPREELLDDSHATGNHYGGKALGKLSCGGEDGCHRIGFWIMIRRKGSRKIDNKDNQMDNKDNRRITMITAG